MSKSFQLLPNLICYFTVILVPAFEFTGWNYFKFFQVKNTKFELSTMLTKMRMNNLSDAKLIDREKNVVLVFPCKSNFRLRRNSQP